VGVQSVTVDGQTVTYDDLLKQYNFWKSRVARENGTRPRVGQIWLGGYR
jgi:sulfur carrier protein ThiS